jgi:prefoldin subunit 5
VRLTLVAGMPVSFRYRLYEPHTPERPLVEDEDRTVNAPLFFESAPPPAPAQKHAARSRAGGMQAAAMMADAAEEEMPEALAMAAPASFSAAEMEESVQVAASGSERGALFAYDVAHPVSVGRGQSAMVPILSQRIPCRRELLYNAHKLPRHPVASLRLTNETGLTLERGPVTVLEDGAYAGEAVVPFTLAEGELIVPFAVELGLSIEEQQRGERQIAGIRVREDYLLIQEYDVRHTTYHLTSTLARSASVTIEHARRSNYELTDTPAPLEEGARFARWEVECAPNARTTFEVRERRLVSRQEQIRSLTGDRIHHYVRNKWLDGELAQQLADVILLYRQVQELQQQIKRIERERDNIYKQQKQIQGNLAPLSNEGGERALRARYVSTLNTLEDKLAELAAEQQRIQQQIEALEQQATERLRALNAPEDVSQQGPQPPQNKV